MRITRKDVLVAIITNAVLLLGIHTTEAEQASPSLSSAQIIEILASPDRTAADRTNDLRRKPEQMLAFIGIRPGIVALDLSAAGGYTTELLARSIGPTGRFTVRAGRAIPTKHRHPPPWQRATAAQIFRQRRTQRRQRPRRGRLQSHWPIVTQSSARPASPPRRSSLSPGPLRIRSHWT
jgi:predicted methyltransferase